MASVAVEPSAAEPSAAQKFERSMTKKEHDLINTAFKKYDIDGNGKLAVHEIKMIVHDVLEEKETSRNLARTLAFVTAGCVILFGVLLALMVAANEASKEYHVTGATMTNLAGNPVVTHNGMAILQAQPLEDSRRRMDGSSVVAEIGCSQIWAAKARLESGQTNVQVQFRHSDSSVQTFSSTLQSIKHTGGTLSLVAYCATCPNSEEAFKVVCDGAAGASAADCKGSGGSCSATLHEDLRRTLTAQSAAPAPERRLMTDAIDAIMGVAIEQLKDAGAAMALRMSEDTDTKRSRRLLNGVFAMGDSDVQDILETEGDGELLSAVGQKGRSPDQIWGRRRLGKCVM